MAIVSNIEERRGLVYIDVDGRLLCAIRKAFFAKAPLTEGDALDEGQYLDRMAGLQLNAAYEEALTLLDFSARASGELKRRLMRKGYLEPAVDAVIARLSENRLVNDQDYAQRVVDSASGKPVGYYALKRKLRAKGVDEDALDLALSSVDEDGQRAGARKLAEKLLPKYHGQEKRQARAKLSQALARRGFSWDVIDSALDGLWDDENWR